MRQERITKENPAATAMATGSEKTNTHEGLTPMRIAVRNFPAYTGRGPQFAALMAGARR